MILKDLNISLLTQLLTQQIEQVICSECCKYYSAPVTAECGHTLCNGCWYGRRKCPLCVSPVERTVLKLNFPLQSLTDHVHTLIETFEKLFNIKLPELELNETDVNKNVTDWLENSQDKFSAHISNISTQDSDHPVTYLTSKAQVHTKNAQTHQTKKDSIQDSQKDWDKIEIFEEADSDKNKENVILPMDIDTIDVDENEYTSEKPRRSTRKKEISTSREPDEVQNEKTDSMSTTTVTKQTTKMKQTWNRAKKMRQEFSKLNKENKNKLNVSIETAKKQVTCEKKLEKDNLTTNITSNITANDTSKETEQEKSLDTPIIVDSDEIISDHTSKKSIANTNDQNLTNQTPSNIPNKKNTSVDSGNPCDNEDVMSPKIKFLKKAPLHVKSKEISHTCSINNNNPDETKRSDDIFMIIKVGKTVANVCIKQGDSNPQVKISTDKEIQTSFRPENNSINLALSENNTRNVKFTQIESIQLNSNNTKQKTLLSNTKSDLVKKNTASTDTRIAHFDIPTSDELPETFEFNDNRQKTQNQKNQSTQKDFTNLEGIQNVFDCELSKNPSVQLLKTSKNVPSAILIPTQNISKTYTPVDKRLRSLDSDELPLKKKQRLKTQNSKIAENNSESSNYDIVMEKVFANIDADIGISQTSKETNKPSSKANSNKNTQVFSQSKNNNKIENQKDSENLFSNFDNDVITQSNKLNTQTKPVHNEILTPNLCREFNSPEKNLDENMEIELGTPLNDESDDSVVEETPQKNVSNIKVKQKSGTSSNFSNSEQLSKNNHNPKDEPNISEISNNLNETLKNNQENTDIQKVKNSIITPSTINKFVEQIHHKSTPVARKSLNFNIKNVKQDAEEFFTEVETTQEKEFMNEVFQTSSQEFQCNVLREKNRKVEYCVAGSCLLSEQTIKLRKMCRDKGWRFVDEYTSDVTHLVIEVDDENKCKRSLKYMRALAAGKWIVGFSWIEKCIQTGTTVPEESFECVDMTGSPGPRRSRLAARKLFTGIAFYCLHPITMLDEDMLKEILVSAGGTLVKSMRETRAGAPGLVLAEPDHTQDTRYEYLAIDVGIVPVHCEWALNSLGQYALAPLEPPLLLCSPTLLQPKLQHWPQELRALIE